MWIYGVCLAIFGCIIGSIGKILLRLSHIKSDENESKSSWFVFLLGTIMVMILNPLFSVLSYAFAPQSMVAPFAGLTVVFNILFGHYLLNEDICKTDIIGSIIITIGCLVVTGASPRDDHHYSYEEIIESCNNHSFIYYIVTSSMIIASLLSIGYSKYTTDSMKKLSFGISSGLLGGNQFVVKALTELLKISTQNTSTLLLELIFLIATGIVCGGGILIMNEGLKRYESIYILPLYQGSFILSSSISGIIFFKEFNNIVDMSVIYHYVFGILWCLFGVFYISIKPKELGSDINFDNRKSVDKHPLKTQ